MSCSIIIPTYNRKKFEKLILHNIKSQNYYNIVEIIVLDDGTDEMFDFRTLNIPIRYIQNMKRCSIGYKRNYGCSIAIGEYIAFMDTDDFYHSNYISNGIFQLIFHEKEVAGSADMIIAKCEKEGLETSVSYYMQKCIFIHMLNEATLIFKKSYWVENKFNETNSGEAVHFLQNNSHKIIETRPHMICIAHGENTVDKSVWLKDEYKVDLKVEVLEKLRDIVPFPK
jgi:glycosyltransferase involved in cell wall biosynthesis